MTSVLRDTTVRRWRATPLTAALALAGLPLAQAATIQVTTPDDPAGTAATCTLRQAIGAMNAASTNGSNCAASGTFGSNDTVSFAASGRAGSAGANTLTLADLAASTLTISAHDLTLMGIDENLVPMTIQRGAAATNKFGVLYDSAPADGSLTVVGTTLANGNVPGPAGTPSTRSPANYGGAISMKNGAALALYASTISGNTAKWGGGGIYSNGDVTLFGSTVSGNSTQHNGGGIYGANRTGALTLVNSTVSGNSAALWGGGIGAYESSGNVTLTNSTIAANKVNGVGYGAGIALRSASSPGMVEIDNTIIAGNLVGSSINSKLASFTVSYYNGTTSPMPVAGIGNLVYQGTAALTPSQSGVSFANTPITSDPLLAALANNGGPTPTMLPLAGSPAIDAADDSVCISGATSSIDQRNVMRPQGAHCDIGAVEVEVAPSYVLTVAVQGPGSVDASGTQPAAPPAPGSISACTNAGGANCSAAFVANTTIALAATPPQTGGYNVSWNGACTATPGNPLQATAALTAAATCNVQVVPTGASIWTVTGNGEPATPGSAACDALAHTCPTLRDAINTAISGDTVVFDAALDNATISLTLYSNLMGCVTSSATTCSDGGTLGREFGPSAFFIDGRSITIDATALAHGVTLARDASADNFRLFDVAPGSGLALKGLVLQNGVAKGGGSGYSGGALGAGGAIFNQGTLDVERCTFSGHAAIGGALVYVENGSGGGGVGQSAPYSTSNGGGPNGGAEGANNLTAGATAGAGSSGSFGGGGGAGGLSSGGTPGAGGNGGFGGGGGKAGFDVQTINYGPGGNGGFGGGGGSKTADGGLSGFGAGNGGSVYGGGGGGMGGAIFNDAGTLTVSNSTFVGNSATGGSVFYGPSGQGSAYGGAIFNYNGALTVAFSTLADNVVQQGAGGIAGTLGGTAIYSLGDSLAACSAGGNTCTRSGATLTMNMSVAARSQGSLKDVTLDAINGGTSTATGAGNFIAYTQALHGTSIGDLMTVNMQGVTDPQLSATLDANGGFGLTLMPLAGSPLIDAVAAVDCRADADPRWGCLTSSIPAAASCSGADIDERGFARPQGALCDIGAVEVRGPRISVDVTTAGGTVSLASPASLGGFGIAFCALSNPDYCTTRVSSEAGAPDIILGIGLDAGYHLASLTSDCGATADAQDQIHIAALAADCTVHVAFAPNVLGGSVQGLVGNGLVLHLDPGDGGSGEDLPVATGATTFAFAAPVASGATWTIAVTQPSNPNQTCTATPDNGTMPDGDVSDIVIACTLDTYTIGGTASGVDAPGLVLQLDGGNDLPVNANGPFTFDASLPAGTAYTVTILAQPAGRGCTLAHAGGIVGSADVTDVDVNCVALPQLALSASDDRDFARYGQVVDYIVTLANHGDGDATDLAVTFTLSAGFDGAFAQFACYGEGGGATCTPDPGNPLLHHVELPAHRTLTWLVSVPVLAETPDVTVEFGVAADGATAVTDADTLVIFRDGFDVPYGDGTQSVPVIEGAEAKAILEGDALREVVVPSAPNAAMMPGAAAIPIATTIPLLLVRDAAHDVRIDAAHAANFDLVRLLERAGGVERATPWSVTHADAKLMFGSEAVADDSKAVTDGNARIDAPARRIVLDGADPAPSLQH